MTGHESDRVRFRCEQCGRRLNAPTSLAGTTATCPACKKLTGIPRDRPEDVFGDPIPALRRPPLLDEEDTRPLPPRPTAPAAAVQVISYAASPASRNAEAGRVCSILSIIFGATGCLLCPIVFAVPGLVLGIIGIVLSDRRTLGVVGVVLSVLSVPIAIALTQFGIGFVDGFVRGFNEARTAAAS